MSHHGCSPPPISRATTSAVKSIVERLSSNDRAMITKEIIASTEEMLRKVAIKIKVGGLGKGDSVENRAVILLDLIMRRNGVSSIANLSKICAMKRKDFESMSSRIGHYCMESVSNSVSVTPKTQATKQKLQLQLSSQYREKLNCNASSQVRNTGSQTKLISHVNETKSIIPVLSVKLGSHIPDCAGVAKLAQYLIKDIQLHVSGMKDPFQRSGYLQDIQRKMTEYEAACFLLIIEENELMKHKETLKSTVIEAASLQPQEFEDIYREAKKFHEIIRVETKRSLPQNMLRQKRQKTQQNSNRHEKSATAAVTAAAKNSATDDSIMMTISEQDKEVFEVFGTPATSYQYSDTFQRWRLQTIAAAIERARLEDCCHGLSDAQALHKAADTILLQRGLVPRLE